MTVKASGVFVDDTVIASLRADAAANNHKNFKLVFPGTTTKTYQGEFMVASFEENATYNGSVNYSITLESSGPVTIT